MDLESLRSGGREGVWKGRVWGRAYRARCKPGFVLFLCLILLVKDFGAEDGRRVFKYKNRRLPKKPESFNYEAIGFLLGRQNVLGRKVTQWLVSGILTRSRPGTV